MPSVFAYLREFNLLSAFLRLVLALGAGGVIGYGRSKKHQSAGLRTYMLVCMGAALTVLISLYESQMFETLWADVVAEIGLKFDGTRYAAAVISGVGFLAAGTILSVEHQQVSGLTTAIGLFATAILGLAAGAGFYEAVLPAVLLIIFTMEWLHPAEIHFKRRIKNITIHVEYDSPADLSIISKAISDRGAWIFDLDEEPSPPGSTSVSAILAMRMGKEHASHSGMLSALAELPCVHSVRELIS